MSMVCILLVSVTRYLQTIASLFTWYNWLPWILLLSSLDDGRISTVWAETASSVSYHKEYLGKVSRWTNIQGDKNYFYSIFSCTFRTFTPIVILWVGTWCKCPEICKVIMGSNVPIVAFLTFPVFPDSQHKPIATHIASEKALMSIARSSEGHYIRASNSCF